jgi:hypothetical protein
VHAALSVRPDQVARVQQRDRHRHETGRLRTGAAPAARCRAARRPRPGRSRPRARPARWPRPAPAGPRTAAASTWRASSACARRPAPTRRADRRPPDRPARRRARRARAAATGPMPRRRPLRPLRLLRRRRGRPLAAPHAVARRPRARTATPSSATCDRGSK